MSACVHVCTCVCVCVFVCVRGEGGRGLDEEGPTTHLRFRRDVPRQWRLLTLHIVTHVTEAGVIPGAVADRLDGLPVPVVHAVPFLVQIVSLVPRHGAVVFVAESLVLPSASST